MEEITPDSQDDATTNDRLKGWFQDNLRIIVSVIIVVVIAGGIYSYSKRSEELVAVNEEQGEEISAEENDGSVQVEGEDQISNEQNGSEDEGQIAGTDTQKAEEIKAPESKETEGSFIEVAVKGNGTTHLARRALADYLEKNSDSALTKEHKIYIEDYLRKNVGFNGKVYPGTSIEFSKDLIKSAIEKSKTLNDRQLENLKQYSARVTSLT